MIARRVKPQSLKEEKAELFYYFRPEHNSKSALVFQDFKPNDSYEKNTNQQTNIALLLLPCDQSYCNKVLINYRRQHLVVVLIRT